MKTFVATLIAGLAITGVASAQPGGQHSVRGYTRSDGTYVAPHMSANPGTYSNSIGGAFSGSTNSSTHRSDGYMTNSGSYVSPYAATNPNSTRNDNFTTRGNVNPFTGRVGTEPRDGEQHRLGAF